MTENRKTVSCIIPAYNEAKTIGKTLQVVLDASDSVTEIIVVDDGSTDGTKDIVTQFPKVRLLVNEKNQGKSKTVARGITESSGEYIFLLDADLAGLDIKNIIDLIQPIQDETADVVLSMRANTPGWMKKINLDFMTGERVFRKSLAMSRIEKMKKLPSFALEVFLNRIIIEDQLRIKTVMMKNVSNSFKWQKYSFWTGVKGEILMWKNIFKVVSVWEWIYQNIRMKKLLVKN